MKVVNPNFGNKNCLPVRFEASGGRADIAGPVFLCRPQQAKKPSVLDWIAFLVQWPLTFVASACRFSGVLVAIPNTVSRHSKRNEDCCHGTHVAFAATRDHRDTEALKITTASESSTDDRRAISFSFDQERHGREESLAYLVKQGRQSRLQSLASVPGIWHTLGYPQTLCNIAKRLGSKSRRSRLPLRNPPLTC